MKGLVFWAGGPAAWAHKRAGEGAAFVLWSEEGEASLREAGVRYTPARVHLTAEEQDAIDEAAIAWTKGFGKRPLLDGRSFRELHVWQGVSLWWFAELFLHHSTSAPGYVRLIEAFHLILEAERPDEVEAAGLSTAEALLLARTCTARGILFHDAPPAASARLRTARVSVGASWNTLKTLLSVAKASLAGGPPRPEARKDKRPVLFLSHAAFWRRRRDPETDELREYEHYFDRLIPALEGDPRLFPFVVAVGPRAAHRRRGLKERLSDWLRLRPPRAPYVSVNRYTDLRVYREVVRATRQARDSWRRLRRSPALHEAFSHRGVGFADLAEPDLAKTLLLQLPWAVRSYEETANVLEAIRPALVCLYAESSGWGRAALAASRAAGVPTLAVQHGILYPKYYSYRHEADEGDCPLPDRTAVFGEGARRALVHLGRYDPRSLVPTGSPKLDDLLRSARDRDRTEIRSRLGVGQGERLLVVASRFRGIRNTHQSIGSAFPALLRAVESLEGVRCVVKPHPAEPSSAYEAEIRQAGARWARVLPPASDLMELLQAADALVTVESLSAVEGLVLGCPVLVLNMPTNIRELVDKGVALGVGEGEDPLPALRAVLFDPETRRRLDEARGHYLSDLTVALDGGATGRIVELIRETAAGPGMVGS